MRSVLIAALIVAACCAAADNLCMNPDFVVDDFGKVVSWALRDMDDVAEAEPNAGPDGSTALRLDLSHGRQLIQSGLKLVPGEPYRLSLDVRSSGFPEQAVEMLVRNPAWNRRGPVIWLPADTHGEWVRVEATAEVPLAQEAFVQSADRLRPQHVAGTPSDRLEHPE